MLTHMRILVWLPFIALSAVIVGLGFANDSALLFLLGAAVFFGGFIAGEQWEKRRE